MSEERVERLHSAEFFGPEREYWWNVDHLQLIADRLDLAAVGSVLDVGCGVGHWGRLLSRVLPDTACVTGVDREPRWVEQAAQHAERTGFGDRSRYQLGTAEQLEFPDGTFDLVTCQTLLIHAASVSVVIREMLRVTRPGGLVLAAEPNNRGSAVIKNSASIDESVEQTLERLRFLLLCERGKIALGDGDSSVGDLVPGHLAEAGAINVQTFISDKAAMLLPPYPSPEQQALKGYVDREVELGTWGWHREDAERYFLAGGGTAADFDAAWQQRLAERHAESAAIANGTFHFAGGAMLYLVAGRKPG